MAHAIVLFIVVFLAALRIDAPAHAYLDPGTGSMILQLVLGSIAAGLVAIKLYWTKVKTFFGRRGSTHKDNTTA